MTQSNNILQELKELESTLTGMTPQNVYAVPNGYFEGLANQVLSRIKAMEAQNASDELAHLSPLLNNLSRQMPYVVPAGYFEALEERILQVVDESNHQTAAEELESISPLLGSLKKEMPYHVPQGYFENLVPQEKNAIPVARVISLTHRKWFRYAAAAVVTGIFVTVGLFLLNKRTSLEKFEAKLNKEIKKTSDKELNDFLKYTEAGQDLAYNDQKEEVKEMLKDVPATELQNFLDEIADPEISPDEKSLNEKSSTE